VERSIGRWARDLLSNERTLWSGRPPNTELLHAGAQGSFFQAQLLGGVARPLDLPATGFEHGQDVIALQELIRDDPILLLFLVLGLGHVIGRVRFGSFQLGPVAGVLIACLQPDGSWMIQE